MKKTIAAVVLAGLFVTLLGAAGFLVVSTVMAQPPQPPDGTPYGPGMMGGGYGRGMGGMMGGAIDGAYGPMHEYMEQAFAAQLGMSEEDLEAQLAEGNPMWQVAVDQGLTEAEAWTAMQTARAEALDQMVADGALSAEQAGWMLQHMQQRGGAGTGSFGCPGMGGGRWNNLP